jgi:hypothetical protein
VESLFEFLKRSFSPRQKEKAKINPTAAPLEAFSSLNRIGESGNYYLGLLRPTHGLWELPLGHRPRPVFLDVGPAIPVTSSGDRRLAASVECNPVQTRCIQRNREPRNASEFLDGGILTERINQTPHLCDCERSLPFAVLTVWICRFCGDLHEKVTNCACAVSVCSCTRLIPCKVSSEDCADSNEQAEPIRVGIVGDSYRSWSSSASL